MEDNRNQSTRDIKSIMGECNLAGPGRLGLWHIGYNESPHGHWCTGQQLHPLRIRNIYLVIPRYSSFRSLPGERIITRAHSQFSKTRQIAEDSVGQGGNEVIRQNTGRT